jgi:hypothetical protein
MAQPQGMKYRLRVEAKTQVSSTLVYKRIHIYEGICMCARILVLLLRYLLLEGRQ